MVAFQPITACFAALDTLANMSDSNSAIPGGADRALSTAARLRTYIKLASMVGGLSTGLYLVYRTFARPGGGQVWSVGQWLAWIFGSGRREL